MHFFDIDHMRGNIAQAGPIPPRRTMVGTTVQIAWPSIAESFMVALVGMVDTMMVGALGPHAIAAVGLTTQPKFMALAFFIALNVAVSATVARRRGEENREGANRVLVQALCVVLVMTALIGTLAVRYADPILRFAGTAPDTHAEATAYFQIIMTGFGFMTVTLCINAAQRGVGNTRLSLYTNLVSNLVNVLFNYLLIGGNFGFPRLGVRGAAIATVIGSFCGLLMSLRSISHREGYLFLFAREHLGFDRRTVQSLVSVGSSTLAEQLFMRIGFLTYVKIVANLGTSEFAAYQIAINILTLSFALGDGLSAAAIALVGRNLGAGRPDLAKIYGGVCQRIGILFSALASVVFLTMGHAMFRLFTDDAVVLSYSTSMMAVLCVVVFLQNAQVVFSACLRAGGDTVYTAVVALISITFVRPGVGWLLCYPVGMGLIGAWLGLAVDQLVRFLLTFTRFHSGRWTRKRL